MIADGDNQQLEQCQFMLSHFTIPEDSGLSAECGRFAYMRKANPEKYWASVAILDDIRSLTIRIRNKRDRKPSNLYEFLYSRITWLYRWNFIWLFSIFL